MPWKDAMRLIFGKGWTYITGDGLTAFFCISPQFNRLKNMEVMNTGVRGMD